MLPSPHGAHSFITHQIKTTQTDTVFIYLEYGQFIVEPFTKPCLLQ